MSSAAAGYEHDMTNTPEESVTPDESGVGTDQDGDRREPRTPAEDG